MDFDTAWNAWEAAGHADCGGWSCDHDGSVRCACGADIPVRAAVKAPDPAPGYEWHRELADWDGAP